MKKCFRATRRLVAFWFCLRFGPLGFCTTCIMSLGVGLNLNSNTIKLSLKYSQTVIEIKNQYISNELQILI